MLVTEDSEFAVGYASVSPVNLLAHTGLVATPHRPVVFIVWQIAAGSSAEFFLEHFLNPASQSHCDLVEQIACQTHLKLIIVANWTSEVIVFVDFANNFAFHELAESMRAVDTPNGENSFGKAVDHVLADFDIVGKVAAAVKQASRPETPI